MTFHLYTLNFLSSLLSLVPFSIPPFPPLLVPQSSFSQVKCVISLLNGVLCILLVKCTYVICFGRIGSLCLSCDSELEIRLDTHLGLHCATEIYKVLKHAHLSECICRVYDNAPQMTVKR